MKNLLPILFIAFAASSCVISETFVYNKDFTGTRIIEFALDPSTQMGDMGMGDMFSDDEYEDEYEVVPIESTDEEPMPEPQNVKEWLIQELGDGANEFLTIDSIFQLVQNIDKYSLDTTEGKFIKLQYDFKPEPLKISDQKKYDELVSRLSEQTKWYFSYSPNTIKKISSNEIEWRILDVDMFNLPFSKYSKMAMELQSASMLITKTFKRKIKSVSSPDVRISPDRYSLKCKVELASITDLKVDNAIRIIFE
ncbi:MAG: hypothetical protein AAFO07_19045 [Bacteroidota bacterium]